MQPSVKEAIAICENAKLSAYEKSFIASVKSRMTSGQPITPKQVTWLFDIEKKVSKTKSPSSTKTDFVNEKPQYQTSSSKERVGVTHGMRGWFAVLYDEDGPINSGIGSYSSPKGAHQEAKEWAEAEGIPCDDLVAEGA